MNSFLVIDVTFNPLIDYINVSNVSMNSSITKSSVIFKFNISGFPLVLNLFFIYDIST